MKKVEVVSTVVNGNLKRNRNAIKKVIEQFEGKTILLTIKLNRKQRSNNQNNYYWGVIIPIWKDILLKEWGDFYSSQETHDFLKYNCNFNERVNKNTGEIIRVSKSTQSNSTTEQEEMHDNCRKLALEMFNVDIPLPNEQLVIS
jgi:hypothetical protein